MSVTLITDVNRYGIPYRYCLRMSISNQFVATATSVPSSSTACLGPTYTISLPYSSVRYPLPFCLFLHKQKRPLSGPGKLSCSCPLLVRSVVCETANGYWRFSLSYGRANGKGLAVFHFPPLSYITRNFGKPSALFAICFQAGFLLRVFLEPEDVATSSSEKSIDFQWTTYYILEVRTLHTHRCDNLKFTSML
jgi:hypothetical protein